MGIATIRELQGLLRAQGVTTAYVKKLAAKQDNDKNQIYLGSGLDSVTNLFPARMSVRAASASTAKRGSRAGQPKMEAALRFAWLDADGNRHTAPGARIIDYFQYPEIRFSGFLAGCEGAPDALRRRHQALYGQRWLVLAAAPDGTVLGIVLTERDDPLARDFPALPALAGSGVLQVLAVDAEAGADPRELLDGEIGRIVAGGWHASVIMRATGVEPFRGAQGAGYTLEALLGVRANADKAPDRHGFEIKSYSGSRISLMTPTPDRGYQGERTFREFMERFGQPAANGDGSRRFVGLFRAGEHNAKHGLSMRVAGYDEATDRFTGPADGIAVEIFDPVTGEVAAGWSLERLANSWNRKHASALYVRSQKNPAPACDDQDEYRYLAPWLIGEGTDVWRLLRAIAGGYVFYDPADTIYADGKAKVRSQWRINAAALPATMERLYARVSVSGG